MKNITQEYFKEERALYKEENVHVSDTVFDFGESPVKECRNMEFERCFFRGRYPVWYSENVTLTDCTMFDAARAGLWYVKNLTVRGGTVAAPKCLRRCEDVTLTDVAIPVAQESLWHCKNVKLDRVSSVGEYFLMNSENVRISHWKHKGNYVLDGVKNIEITDSELVTKDAFWNCENVYVKDSIIFSEYLGWNSKNITLENCTVNSLQGLCYIEGLKLINCRLMNTDLAFEKSTVDATVIGNIVSVYNPEAGTIKADSIGEVVMDPAVVNPENTSIEADVGRYSKEPTWTI
ncbi:MAG: DUF3737 family protein [Clostridia bacterium]|nr:DUF3737 family protein [Clostridia bacterium]